MPHPPPPKKPQTPSRLASIHAIKTHWSLTTLASLFSACSPLVQKKLYQLPLPPTLKPASRGAASHTDDFFEDATLALLEQLAAVAPHAREEVKQRLRKRWRARSKGGKDGVWGLAQLRCGEGWAGKNESLRVDLGEFIGEFRARAAAVEEQQESASDAEAESLRSDEEDVAHGGEDDEGDDGDEPAASRQPSPRTNFGPSERALSSIRTAWNINPPHAHPFSILPQHAFDPATRNLNQPFKYTPELLGAIYNLAQATRGRESEVKKRLRSAFRKEKEFKEWAAIGLLEEVQRGFEEEEDKE